jgi:hypothetical protein
VSDSYKNPKWQKKRLQILDRDGWKCVACGDEDSTLHVHHREYSGEPWEVDDKSLQTLCEKCHGYFGEHPKGGLWWARDDAGPFVVIFWCPKCGSTKFKVKGSYVKCSCCSWRSNYESVRISRHITFVDESDSKKPKQYSLGWISGIMTKVRRSGVSELEIFDAVFPESPARIAFQQLEQCTKELKESVLRLNMTDDEFAAHLERIVKARRAAQGMHDEVCGAV